MSLFRRKSNLDFFEAVSYIVFGIKRALYPDGMFWHGDEQTQSKNIGLFRTGDRLFSIMINPACKLIPQHSGHGHRMIYSMFLSEDGKTVIETAQRLLIQDGIVLGNLKACIGTAEKDIGRDELNLNIDDLNAPILDLPLRMMRHNRSVLILDPFKEYVKTAKDFTIWFCAKVTYPTIADTKQTL